MKKLRAAFTLIEMMIAISIFSIMMLYLYKSYSTLNISNNNLKVEVRKIQDIQKIKKVIFLDFTLALYNSIKIDNRDKGEDFVFFQSSHSIHKRINPYITYMVKDKKLYRLESLKPITTYELPSDEEFDIDLLGTVKSFKVYKTTKKESSYLVAINFKSMDDILLRVNPLNEY
ncbi:PulJ/GspJ family protein [Sulfurimonas sp.]